MKARERIILPKSVKKADDNRLVHRLIARTAKELAGTFYEFAAHDNEFYKFYPKMQFFIDREWERFVTVAKEVLTDCLKSGALTEGEKGEIYDALILDATLPYSNTETQITNFRH